MTQLTVLGVSYRTASLCVREKLAFDLPAILSCSRALLMTGWVQAIAVVSTCHRTEFYCDNLAPQHLEDFWRWLQENRQFPSRETLGNAVYHYTNSEAIQHLLRVSAGLDSLILGETQILGQMKLAYDQAMMAGTLGKHLTRLFQFAFGVAKHIRTKTFIGANSLSVACIASRLVNAIHPLKRPLKVMFIGSGEMIWIAAKRFQRLHIHKPIFANRTPEKILSLAEKFEGEICPLSAIGDQLSKIDVLVTATASPLPLLNESLVKQALKIRQNKPLLLIDLAVPRDIEPQAGLLPNVSLYTVDDLQEMAIGNRHMREKAAISAEKIVEQKTQQFMDWLAAQSSIKNIRQYRDKCTGIRELSIKEALIQLKNGKPPEHVIQHLAHRLTNRLIHEPTLALRASVFKNKKIIKKTETMS